MAPLEIIGSGWSRTGTAGMREALIELGYKPLHMLDIMSDPEVDTTVYEEAYNGEDVDWNRALANYNVSLDFPNAAFYKQFMKIYPDAKVIHTTRDPEKWYESAIKTVYIAAEKLSVSEQYPKGIVEGNKAVEKIVFQGYFGGKFEDKERTIQMFKDHEEEVKRTVPADKLLVFETGVDGWDKLCSFLGKEIPDKPWPHLNTRQDFDEAFQGLHEKKEFKNFSLTHDIYAKGAV